MNDIIKKLRERKILNTDSLVESTITKNWYGSPVDIKATLIVKELKENFSTICKNLCKKLENIEKSLADIEPKNGS